MPGDPRIGSSVLYAGTSGWAYPAWKPAFYPAKLAQKDFLKFYSTQLNAVEVNYTFRRFLTEKIIAGWVAQTPADFRFAVKAHQAITHHRRLKNAEEPLARFVASIQPLAQSNRLGPALFQLPPNLEGDPRLLDSFLELLPRKLQAAFEFRHRSWFSEDVFAVLRRHQAALCIAENDDSQTPAMQTTSFSYFRYRRSEYPEPERHRIVTTMRKLVNKGSGIYAFFKHEERPEGALYAQELLQAVNRGSGKAA